MRNQRKCLNLVAKLHSHEHAHTACAYWWIQIYAVGRPSTPHLRVHSYVPSYMYMHMNIIHVHVHVHAHPHVHVHACICTWTIQIVCVMVTPTNMMIYGVTSLTRFAYMMYVRVLTFGFFSITISDSRSNSGSMKSRSPVPSQWTTRGCWHYLF